MFDLVKLYIVDFDVILHIDRFYTCYATVDYIIEFSSSNVLIEMS